MARLWSREEPQFFNIHGLDWVPSREVRVLDGVETRLLSSDDDRTSTTTMARLPAGWDAVESGEDATVEFFVLEGDLEINGDAVGAGGYAFIPRGASGDTDLRSVAGAQVIVFSNASMIVALTSSIGVRHDISDASSGFS